MTMTPEKRDMETRALMTTAEAADYLSTSTSTMSRWRLFKSGPDWINIGTLKSPTPRYLRSDLEAWIASRKVTP